MAMRVPTLSQLVQPLPLPPALADMRPTAVDLDSRNMVPGALFVACKGARHERLDFIADARARGAAAALVDAQVAAGDLPLIHFPALRSGLGQLAGRYYDWPDQKMHLTAVTGTAGKTTTAWMAAQILHTSEAPCGYLGTVGAGLMDGRPFAVLANTTPDPLSSRKTLRWMLDQGATAAVMEASSQGLEQGRLAGFAVEVAAFTNLGNDHRSAHGGVDGLKNAKRSLFEMPSVRQVVLNIDDPFGEELKRWLARHRPELPVLTYGCSTPADLRVDPQDSSFQLGGKVHRLTAPLGQYNGYNLGCALGIAQAVIGDWAEVCRRAQEQSLLPARLPPGRLEKLFEQPTCYLDYAHSPEALAASLEALRGECSGQLWCVFGCGGERDRAKRPLMGQVAASGADRLVLTEDNSRGEEAAEIVAQVQQGIGAHSGKVMVELNRARAIELALHSAAANDLVLIAGKGHEEYLLRGDDKLPFSDRAVAQGWKQCVTEHQKGEPS